MISRDLLRTFFASGSVTTFGNIELGTRIGAIWFLPALFFSIIIFQFLVSKIKDNRTLGIAAALVSLAGYSTGRFIWLPFSVQAGLFAVFFLWIGYVIKNRNLLEKIKFYHWLIGLIVLLVGIYYEVCRLLFVDANANDLLLSPIVGLAGALVIYGVAKLTEKSKFLRWLGNNSLTLLCIHLISLETLGRYYGKVLDLLQLEGNASVWVRIILELVVVIVCMFLLNLIREKVYQSIKKAILQKKQQSIDSQAGVTRSHVADIARGLLIISMLIGHFDIDPGLRNVIYSCHMVAFVFLSGYFYKQKDSLGKVAKRMLRTFLLPYLICCLFNILLDFRLWSGTYFIEILERYVLGMSFSRRLLPDIASVGPVYFILMLFVVRLLYKLIDTIIHNETVKWIIILGFTVLGILLGNRGFWLPWSIDVAFYSLFFYQLGVITKRYALMNRVTENPWVYFLLSPLWFYMILGGGMEIAVRQYAPYGLVVVGAMSGILLICCLSAYFEKATVITSPILAFIGRASIVIIIVHVLINSRLNGFLGRFLEADGFARMVISLIVQILLACLLYFLISKLKKLRKRRSV